MPPPPPPPPPPPAPPPPAPIAREFPTGAPVTKHANGHTAGAPKLTLSQMLAQVGLHTEHSAQRLHDEHTLNTLFIYSIRYAIDCSTSEMW